MGFLTGNFQNLMLTRLINQNQRSLTSVMSRLRTAKKQAENVEKSIDNWKRTQQNIARTNMNNSVFQMQAQGLSGLTGQQVSAEALMNNPGMSASLLSGLSASQQTNYSTNMQSQTATVQANMQTYIANIEQEAEVMKEMQLEPLKDLETDLEIEKEQLQSDIQLYTQWKEGAKEDVQNSAKNLKPNYGGNA